MQAFRLLAAAALVLLGLLSTVQASTARVLRYESSSGRGGITFSTGAKAWFPATASYYSGGSTQWSDRQGATFATKNLAGVSRFALIGTTGHGVFDVEVDGKKTRVDLRRKTLYYNQVVYRSPALNPNVKHSLKVTVVGGKSEDINEFRTDIDALDVTYLK